jgi:Plant transposon protein
VAVGAPGKAPKRDLGRRQAAIDIDRDYIGRLGTSPVFSNSEFERRYRMPRCVYKEVRARVLETDNYFHDKSDALGRPGVSTDVKITAALRQLSLGVGSDGVVEYCRVSESTASESLKRFCAAVPTALGHVYLRNPTAQELERIEAECAALGFPGCIGCVDCESWEWDNCPIAWQGNHRGKGKKAECRMDVVGDDYLYIWHLMFGTPGSKNDINIMNASPLFNDIRAGKWPPCRPQMEVLGFPLSWFYYLAVGMCPRFRISVLTRRQPRSLMAKLFAKHHEGARKSLERVFGVLFKRFGILYRPSRLCITRTRGMLFERAASCTT